MRRASAVVDQPLDVLDLERLDLLVLDARRLRERDRVADDVPTTQRLPERRARRAVHLVRVAGRAPVPGFRAANR